MFCERLYKRINKDLRKDKDLLKSFIGALPVAVFFKDVNGYYHVFPDSKLCHEEVLFALASGQCDDMSYGAGTCSGIEAPHRASLIRQILVHGELLHYHVLLEPVRDKNGSFIGMAGALINETEIVQTNSELEKEGTIDPMTGAFNRLGYETFISVKDSSLFPALLINCDISLLKYVNDNLGHLHGDEVIIDTAEKIIAAAPKDGLLFRMGGDEFLCICPNVDENKIPAIEQKLRANTCGVMAGGIPTAFACGFAVASSIEEMAAAEQAADCAMYEDKRGKSRDIEKRLREYCSGRETNSHE